MAVVRGWVFDLDGVLIDSEPIHWRAWQEVVRRRGREMGPEWLRVGIGMTDILFFARHGAELGLDPRDKTTLEEKNAIFQGIVEAEGMPLCPGAKEALSRLGGRYPIGVATSSSRPYLERALKARGWENVFRSAWSRDDVSRPKPDPEIYARASAGLGLSPRECVAIEDSPTGLASARAAGLRTVALRTHFDDARLEEAELRVDSLEDLDLILKFAGAAA